MSELTLKDKQEKLNKSGFDMVQKMMIKELLGNLTFIALDMGVDPQDAIINLTIHQNQDATIIISNWKNDQVLDWTETARQMEDDEAMVKEFVGELLEIMRDCAEFWKTEPENIKFRCWTAEEFDIGAEILPIVGFDKSERLYLTEARKVMSKV